MARNDDPRALSAARKPAVTKAPPSPSAHKALPVEIDADDCDAEDAPAPRERRRFPLWTIVAALLALSVAVVTVVFARGQASAPAQPAAVADAPLASSVAAPGLVEAVSGVRNLAFDVGGKIKAVFVEEGQAVKAGKVLAQLENADVAARLESARAELSIAEAKQKIVEGNLAADLIRAQKDVERLAADLAAIEKGPRHEQIDAARAEAAAAEAESRRGDEQMKRYADPTGKFESWSKNLFDEAKRQAEGGAAKFAAAKAQLAELEAGARIEDREKARAMLASAQNELTRQKTTAPFQLNAASGAVAFARAQIAVLEAQLAKTLLTSPIDGTVVWKFLHAGNAVDGIQHQPVIAVADTTKLRVRASIDEADYPRIQKGQRVQIRADAFPGKFFEGRVDHIGHAAGQKPFSTGEATERLDVRVIETTVTLEPNAPFKLGLRVTAYFEVGK